MKEEKDEKEGKKEKNYSARLTCSLISDEIADAIRAKFTNLPRKIKKKKPNKKEK